VITITEIANGFLVTVPTGKIENYAVVEDGGTQATAFTFTAIGSRPDAYARALLFITNYLRVDGIDITGGCR